MIEVLLWFKTVETVTSINGQIPVFILKTSKLPRPKSMNGNYQKMVKSANDPGKRKRESINLCCRWHISHRKRSVERYIFQKQWVLNQPIERIQTCRSVFLSNVKWNYVLLQRAIYQTKCSETSQKQFYLALTNVFDVNKKKEFTAHGFGHINFLIEFVCSVWKKARWKWIIEKASKIIE